MKKLLLVLVFLTLINSCSKGDDDSSSEDFFENHSGKIWGFTYQDNDEQLSYTDYYTFSNRTPKILTYYDGQHYCTELFLGTINDISHPNNGWQCNITNEIIVNKSNELQIETIVTDPDGTLKYTYVITFKVNGDNLVSSSSALGEDGFIATIYKGNLNLAFTNCVIEYIL